LDLTRNIHIICQDPLESGGLVHPFLQPHTIQTLAMQQQYHDVPATAIPPMHRRQLHSKQRFVTELSQRLFEFVIQLLPTQEEMAVKEDVRKLLERLIRTIEPDSRLLSFGSTANGFSLRNSGESLPLRSRKRTYLLRRLVDMDLCCLIDCEERLSATDLVTMLGDLLERGQSCSGPFHILN
jgi:terminal uridylyltransferase